MASVNRQRTNQMRGWEGGLGVGVYSGDVSGCESDLQAEAGDAPTEHQTVRLAGASNYITHLDLECFIMI